jgi:hypothetical protein
MPLYTPPRLYHHGGVEHCYGVRQRRILPRLVLRSFWVKCRTAVLEVVEGTGRLRGGSSLSIGVYATRAVLAAEKGVSMAVVAAMERGGGGGHL